MRHVMTTVALLAAIHVGMADENDSESKQDARPTATQAEISKVSDEEKQLADAEKKRSLDEIDAKIREADKLAKAAAKAKDKALSKERKDELSWLRKQRLRLVELSQEEYLKKHYDRQRAEAKVAFADEHQKARMQAAGPIYIVGHGIVTNIIGMPELVLVVRNTTSKTVEAFDITAECANKFGEAVNFPGQGNAFRGTWQTRIAPGETMTARWQLSLHRNTTKAWTWVNRVKLADGTVWQQTKGEAQEKQVGYVLAENPR